MSGCPYGLPEEPPAFEIDLVDLPLGDPLWRGLTAFAMGYLGGGLLLALNLAWITFPQVFGLPSGDG